MKLPVTCQVCGTIVFVKPSHVSTRKFCSRRCSDQGSNRWQTPCTCDICDQSFLGKDERNRFCKTCVPDETWLSIAQHYGLSKAAYELLVEAQGNRCKICRCQPTGSHHFKRLHVDHNHETGEVRGLLCPRCNVAVGFVESHGNIEDVVTYLQRAFSRLRLVG